MTRRRCLWQLINIGSSSTVFLPGIIPSPGHRWHRSDLLCWIGLARCQMWWIRWHNLGQSVIHKMDVCRGWGHSVTNINNTRTYPRESRDTDLDLECLARCFAIGWSFIYWRTQIQPRNVLLILLSFSGFSGLSLRWILWWYLHWHNFGCVALWTWDRQHSLTHVSVEGHFQWQGKRDSLRDWLPAHSDLNKWPTCASIMSRSGG